jgi:hypothetical protein
VASVERGAARIEPGTNLAGEPRDTLVFDAAAADIAPAPPGVDADALRRVLAGGDGSLRITEALRLRPDDASMRFAAALVSAADERKSDYNTHARLARAGIATDALLARNIGQVAGND